MRVEEYAETAPGSVVETEAGPTFCPEPLAPTIEVDPELYATAAEAAYALGRLREIGNRVDDHRVVRAPSLHREAVASLALSGTEVTLADVYAHRATDGGAPSVDAGAAERVVAYVDAVEAGFEHLSRGDGVTVELLADLQDRLVVDGPTGPRTDRGGVGRAPDGTAAYVPPPPAVARRATETLERYVDRGGPYGDLIDAGLVAYQLATLRPFAAGNDRLSRLLVGLVLYDRDLLAAPNCYPSVPLARRDDRYCETLLAVAKRGAWRAWLAFFLEAVRAAATDASRRARRLLALRDKYRVGYEGAPDSARRLALALFEHPVVTVRHAERVLDSAYSTANDAVDRLVADGVLVEVTGKERNRRYHATEVLAAITGDLVE